MASKWLKFRGMHDGQNMEHATHASKASKRHARQSSKHENGTEIACRVVPNHHTNAKMPCFTFICSRPTSPNTKELYQACQNQPKHLWTNLKHARNKGTQPKAC